MCDHDEGPRHDCDYVDWRDSLVPVAAAVADIEQPHPGGDDALAWTYRWDAAFHRAMEKLVRDGVGR